MATPRKVRCQRCGREWLAAPEPDEATQPDIPPPEVEHPLDHEDPVEATLPPVTAMDRLSASAPRPRTMPTLMAAWVMTFVALAAAVAAIIIWREPLVRLWPPSGRVLGVVAKASPDPSRHQEASETAK